VRIGLNLPESLNPDLKKAFRQESFSTTDLINEHYEIDFALAFNHRIQVGTLRWWFRNLAATRDFFKRVEDKKRFFETKL